MDSRCADPVILGPSAGVIRVVERLRLATNILVGAIVPGLAVRRLRELLHWGR